MSQASVGWKETAPQTPFIARKDSKCYVCGADNPLGLRVPFSPNGPHGSMARYTARPEHGGWNGILHGGVTFALMDEALGWSLYYQKIPAVSARVDTRFHKPIPVGAQVIVKAWVVEQRRRFVKARAEIRIDGPAAELLAEADATMCMIREIREFQPGDEAAFRELNEEWITRYFRLEKKDEEALANPQAILDAGGRIFFTVTDGRPVACCALLYLAPGEFEVAKMAVTASCQGTGAGRQLLEAVVQAARDADATRLYLETNHTLTPAITLYHSAGFTDLPADRIVPSPYARADVYMEMFLK